MVVENHGFHAGRNLFTSITVVLSVSSVAGSLALTVLPFFPLKTKICGDNYHPLILLPRDIFLAELK